MERKYKFGSKQTNKVYLLLYRIGVSKSKQGGECCILSGNGGGIVLGWLRCGKFSVLWVREVGLWEGNNKYIIICMLSPQSKKGLGNAPSNNPSKQKFGFLLKVCSSSAIKSGDILSGLQDEQSALQGSNYSKLLKQKDMKILNLMEKVRALESDLARYQNSHNILQNDLQFFKAKIQEEFIRNMSLQSEIQNLNCSIKSFISQLMNVQGNKSKLQLQSTAEQSHIDTSKRLLTSLESQLPQIAKLINLHSKQHPSKTDPPLPSPRLPITPRQGFRDSDDYKEEIHALRVEREYIKELLVNLQKEKNEVANDLYQIARGQYKIDFYHMNKPEVVKLTIELIAKIKHLQHDKAVLLAKLHTFQTIQRDKYENMLSTVKQIEKQSDKKVSIKKIASLNYIQ